jgi:flagellin
MIINTNTSAQVSANHLQQSHALLGKSLARLSSGSRIVSPADDAAGLAVASRLDAQTQRLNAAKSNVGNAISFTQTQDGYLKEIGKALNRMSELSILAQDVTKSDADRVLYDNEFQQLASFITSAASKEFNGVSLFSTDSLDVTIDSEGNSFTMDGIDLSDESYTDATGANLETIENSKSALQAINAAITRLSEDRATVGAYQSRLNYTAEQLTVSSENLVSASSRIQDVNVAEESTNFARHSILVQSGTAMLAQANQLPQTVLRLLQ